MMDHRQKDHTVGALALKRHTSRLALQCVITKRRTFSTSASASSAALLKTACFYVRRRNNHDNHHLSLLISLTDFGFNFNAFSDLDCLTYLRFRKHHIIELVSVMAWPETKRHTSRNRYRCTPLLATCVVLRRLAAPARWRDLEELLGKHSSQLSEVFWEALEMLLNAREHLLTGDLSPSLIHPRLESYAAAVYKVSRCLPNCVGFIDGTVLGIARPKGNLAQRVVYNGHKRTHALKYQAINIPDGMIMHLHGIEGRLHDWTLYVRSGLDEALPLVLEYGGRQYCIYGDSGYNSRWFMEVPFQGASLTAAQKAFNKAMSGVRITVEWVFKELKMHFATVDFKRKMKIFESPYRYALYWVDAAIKLPQLLLSQPDIPILWISTTFSPGVRHTQRPVIFRAGDTEERGKSPRPERSEGAKQAAPQGALREEKLAG